MARICVAGPDMRRRFTSQIFIIGSCLALLAATSVLGGCVYSAPRYHGQVSDHFDGRRFHNAPPTDLGGIGAGLRWLFTRERGPWREPFDAPPGPRPPARVGDGALRVTFVNHATTLVQMDGINVLTDPIWSERCSPVTWTGPKRFRPPGIRFEDLPSIDVVVVSHNHYDHMDLPTLKRLAAAHHPRIFVPLGNRALLEREGIPGVEELDWWQSVEVKEGVRISSVPAQHFSGRGLWDRDRTLWSGYVVTGPAGPVYFAGDTAFGPHFAQIRERFGPVRLAILPIGAFLPRWVMSQVHATPEESVTAHRVLEAGTSVGMHFGTFRLADDGQDEPAARIEAALSRSEVPKPRFWVLEFGEGRDVPALGTAAASVP